MHENTQTKYNSKSYTTQNTAQQNYPGSVASYDTQPGDEMGLFYNALEPLISWCSQYKRPITPTVRKTE